MEEVVPSGAVTTADLYREMRSINETVIRLDERQAQWMRDAQAVHSDHEMRLRVIERFRYTLMGAAMMAGTASGVISAVLTQKH